MSEFEPIEHDAINEQAGDVENSREAEQNDWNMADALAVQADTSAANMALTGQPEAPPLGVVLTPMIFAGFTLLAPNWKVSEGECSALSQSWADVIEHYFPNTSLSPGMAVVVTAIGTTGAVVGSRVMEGIPRKVEETS